MPTAYVLITSDLGNEEPTIKEIKKIPEVKEIRGVYGVFDIVVKVESEDIDHLKHAVMDEIRRTDGVRSANTLIVVEGQGD